MVDTPYLASNATVNGASKVSRLPLISLTTRSHVKSISPSFHPKALIPPPKMLQPKEAIHSLPEGRVTIIRSPFFREVPKATSNVFVFTGT